MLYFKDCFYCFGHPIYISKNTKILEKTSKYNAFNSRAAVWIVLEVYLIKWPVNIFYNDNNEEMVFKLIQSGCG